MIDMIDMIDIANVNRVALNTSDLFQTLLLCSVSSYRSDASTSLRLNLKNDQTIVIKDSIVANLVISHHYYHCRYHHHHHQLTQLLGPTIASMISFDIS